MRVVFPAPRNPDRSVTFIVSSTNSGGPDDFCVPSIHVSPDTASLALLEQDIARVTAEVGMTHPGHDGRRTRARQRLNTCDHLILYDEAVVVVRTAKPESGARIMVVWECCFPCDFARTEDASCRTSAAASSGRFRLLPSLEVAAVKLTRNAQHRDRSLLHGDIRVCLLSNVPARPKSVYIIRVCTNINHVGRGEVHVDNLKIQLS